MKGLLLRLVVTTLLLALVVSQVDWAVIGERLREGDPGWLLVAVASVGAALAVGALRWGRLLHAAGLEVPAPAVARIYAMSTFAQSFLPTGVGGDAARVVMVARRGRMAVRAFSTVVLDRASGFVGLVLLTWAVVLAFPDSPAPDGAIVTLAIVSAAMVAATLVLWQVRKVPARAGRWVPDTIESAYVTVRSDAIRVARRPRVLGEQLALSLLFQLFNAIQVWAIGRWIGIDVGLVAMTVALALVTLALLIPVSVGGFGVREGGYVVLLGTLGVSVSDATLLSVTTVVVLLIASLPGAALLITSGIRPWHEGDDD